MSKEVIERWYNSLEDWEKDMPVIKLDGKYWTPEEIYREVMNGTDIGEKLQEKIERLASPNTLTYEELKELREVAYQRAKKLIEKLPKGFSIATFSGKVYSGEDILKLLREELVDTELEDLLKILRRVRYG